MTYVILTLAALAFLAAGYLAGARLGRVAREALRKERDAAALRTTELEAAVEREAGAATRSTELLERLALAERERDVARTRAETASASAAELSGKLERGQRELEEARAKAAGLAERHAAQERELETLRENEQKLRETIAQAARSQERWMQSVRAELGALSGAVEKRGADAAALSKALEQHLAPIAERDRLGRALATLPAQTRLDLGPLLDAIAVEGGFAAVHLSDDLGLPLAASRNAQDAEAVAGASALLSTYADRLRHGGMPAPLATLIHDEADRLTLHRVLTVRGQRYMLTALGRGHALAYDSLEPAMDVVERVLGRGAWEIASATG